MNKNNEAEVLKLLESDKKSVRIQAIVKLARIGTSEKALAILQNFVASNDRETAFFATQATAKILKRKGLTNKDLPLKTNQNSLNITASLLLSPPKDLVEKILSTIREDFTSIDPKHIASIGVFLSKHGDITDSTLIEKQLMNDDSALVIPFISAAEKIAPQILTRALPNLLSSSSPIVRSRAISALLQIDSEEAERHFTDFLSSTNPEDRLAGIGIAFQFPFERAKEYVLSILPDEKDKDVIQACQSFFASNPSIDIALRMLDIIDIADSKNKNALTSIFKNICKALSVSKIIPKNEASPTSIVKLWKKNRLKNFLSDLEIQLNFVDSEKKQKILKWIDTNKNNPEVAILISRLKSNPQTEHLFKSAPKADKIQKTNRISDNPIERIKKINLENFNNNKNFLINEIKHGEIDSKRMALNCMFKYHPSATLRELAKETIKLNDSKLKAISLKILAKLSSNFLIENIETLLKTSDIAFRVRVLRFALKHARKKAIYILQTMLQSQQESERTNAISCLALCPFNEVKDILLNHLDSEEHPMIAKQIIDIFISNPSQEILNSLDSITKISKPALSMILSQGRHELFEQLLNSPEHTIEAHKNKTSEESKDKPYSISNVRKITKAKQKNWQASYKSNINKKQVSKQSNYDIKVIIPAIILFILMVMSPIMFLHESNKTQITYKKRPKDWREKEYKKYSKSLIPRKFKMNTMCSIPATVKEVKDNKLIVVKFKSSKILVNFAQPFSGILTTDDKITITMVPNRVTPSGYIVAKGKGFELQKGN